jgi:hypothetical protein
MFHFNQNRVGSTRADALRYDTPGKTLWHYAQSVDESSTFGTILSLSP